ncbi:hypothetical protein CRG98_031253 [Punica granatum]|uniref:Uncharacterized protein n=1 Tax=Punica granatum TaxID=22663 RepID=A0A2I0IWK4_PUNGR|nr:hypothetical protein CRG98_031253 [Punica granatum]
MGRANETRTRTGSPFSSIDRGVSDSLTPRVSVNHGMTIMPLEDKITRFSPSSHLRFRVSLRLPSHLRFQVLVRLRFRIFEFQSETPSFTQSAFHPRFQVSLRRSSVKIQPKLTSPVPSFSATSEPSPIPSFSPTSLPNFRVSVRDSKLHSVRFSSEVPSFSPAVLCEDSAQAHISGSEFLCDFRAISDSKF